MSQKYPPQLLTLVAHLKKLPGVGAKTAERFAFELLKWPENQLALLGKSLETIQKKIPPCEVCGCLTDLSSCLFCEDKRISSSQLCIVSSPREVYTIEETKSYRGLYHVIEHLLSPLDGRLAKEINIQKIKERILQNGIQEVILAFDSTLEGDTTALYIKEELKNLSLSISRLAFGLPVGSSLDYIDGGTLTRALNGRQIF